MSSLGGAALFASGPHEFRTGAWERRFIRRSMAGACGEMIMDLGVRSRVIVQTGRLQAQSAGALQSLIDTIGQKADGQPYTLVDNHGQTYPSCVIEKFELASALQRGRGFWCDYSIEYRQLP